MWNPSAISPYMLPRPMPEMMAEASIRILCTVSGETYLSPLAGRGKAIMPLIRQRQDFVALEVGEDVIRRRQRVLIVRRERPVIGLDQAVILADLVKTLPDCR